MKDQYESDGVIFSNVKAGILTDQKITKTRYIYDDDGKIIGHNPVINSIDIDWNNAQVPGIENNIESTAKLLKIIGALNNAVKEWNNTFDTKVQEIIDEVGPKEKYKHVILTQEEYEALEEYEEDALYMVIGDAIAPTPTPEPTPSGDPFENISTDLQISYLDSEGILQEISYTEDGKITLDPQRSYTLEGTLVGSIEIDTSSLSKVNNDTELILNDVKILSNTDNAILYKIPEGAKAQKSLKITLAPNVENYIYCTLESENTDNQGGAIYSMNNLNIQGTGYLAIKTKTGHGVRGDIVNLAGSHIWIEAPHDGIHGRDINIIGGIYSMSKCNDAIGTSNSGRVLFYDGKLYTSNIKEDIIDSKNTGLYFSEDLLTTAQLQKCNNMSLISENKYKSIFGNTNGAVYLLSEQPDFDNDDVTILQTIELDENEDKYIISSTKGNKGKYILATGYIDKPIQFDDYGSASGDNVTLYLSNAFINIETNEPSVYYSEEGSNIKIMSVQDSVNVIKNNYSVGVDPVDFLGDCVKSENNIEVELKANSYLYISSLKSDGLDGGDIKITDSKGNLIITKCGQRGIKGNAIVIGPDAEIVKSNISQYYTPEYTSERDLKYTTFDGICYVKNNCQAFIPIIVNGSSDNDKKNSGFADIYARNGKASLNKGQIGTRNIELIGVLITGTLGAVNKIDMGAAKRLYYSSIITASSKIENPVPATGSPSIYNEVEPTDESKNVIDF